MIARPNLGFMNRELAAPSTTTAATAGLLALASAMGIGRFSLTPILPLMQHDMDLTLSQGSWLATGNYLGYLAGALVCMTFAPSPVRSIRWGLVAVAVFTLAMAAARSSLPWFAFRFFAGAASAFVLVGTSAWAMPILARSHREHWAGGVFAGVGIGIALAGLLSLAAAVDGWDSRAAWTALGLVAAALAGTLWRPLVGDRLPPASPETRLRQTLPRQAWVTAGCYGLFGYGYIIPATFLPALARSHIDNPVVFGWIWPLFGTAAAISTVVAARWGHRLTPRRMWVRAQWVLAAGVLAPLVSVDVVTLLIAAVCVGGTFMIITMAGIRELLRIGGGRPSTAVGMMTAAFAIGQIAGPLTVSLFAGSGDAFAISGLIAAAGLVASNCVLLLQP
jgi:MFS family permease